MDNIIEGTLIGGVVAGIISVFLYTISTGVDDRWFIRLFCVFVCLGFVGVLRKLDQLIEK